MAVEALDLNEVDEIWFLFDSVFVFVLRLSEKNTPT